MHISAPYHPLNSPSPRVYYSIQVTTHTQKDVPSNNTYNIDSYTISSYRLNFHVRTVARFLSGLKRLRLRSIDLYDLYAGRRLLGDQQDHPLGL